MKHINIPIFIPHLGCPNQCIFCNQKSISGVQAFSEDGIDEQINAVLSSVDENTECEIAFFGGSFTGIDRDLMIRLLDKAQQYVDCGKVSSIRMSTRPDYINSEIVEILKNYKISFVELGIQTMNDSVLSLLKRGHTVSDTVLASKLLKDNGINFVGQMMVGLPGATAEDEIYCAEMICKLGASASRIYPTLVFKNTELENMLFTKDYIPLSLEEAVERSANVLEIFIKNNVNCIRIGLCDSDNLHSSETYLAGPNSPSIGEMVKSRLIYKQICSQIDKNTVYDCLTICCPLGKRSQVIGHKRENMLNLKKHFKINEILVLEKENINNLEIKIKEGGKPCV